MLEAIAKSLLLYGASSDVVGGPCDGPARGLTKALHQSLSILGDKVGEPYRFGEILSKVVDLGKEAA
jgi:hypothetical protein